MNFVLFQFTPHNDLPGGIDPLTPMAQEADTSHVDWRQAFWSRHHCLASAPVRMGPYTGRRQAGLSELNAETKPDTLIAVQGLLAARSTAAVDRRNT